MTSIRTAIALLALSGTAAAEPLAPRDGMFFEAGLGAPTGVTAGLGVESGALRGWAELGGLALGTAGILSAAAHVQGDVRRWNRFLVSAGLSASVVGFLVAGGEAALAGSLMQLGPTIELRMPISKAARRQLAIHTGMLFGECRGDCQATRSYVMLEIGARITFAMF